MKSSVLRSRKGQAHPIMALVIGAVVLFIGIYTVMQVIGSISLPTKVVKEDIVLVNATAATVSYPYMNSIVSVSNSTDTLPHTVANTSCSITATQITCYFDGGAAQGVYHAGTWGVAYNYNPQVSNTTYLGTQATFWNSIQLGAVSLITLAASLVLGSFFFK